MRTAVGLFDMKDEAELALERLQLLGIGIDALSLPRKEGRASRNLARSIVAYGEGATPNEGPAVIGQRIVFSGIGSFLIGGPLAATFEESRTGSDSGGLVDGLVAIGISSEEAEHFSAGMESGMTLIGALVDEDRATDVRRIFDEEGSLRSSIS